MMSSYLIGIFSSQFVANDDRPDLLDLIGFGLIPKGLKIEDFSDSVSSKNGVIPTNPSFKTQ